MPNPSLFRVAKSNPPQYWNETKVQPSIDFTVKNPLPYIEIVFNKEKRVFIIRDVDKKNAQVINELSEKEIKWFYDGGSYTSLPKEIKLKLKCKDVVFESVLRKMKRN